MGKVAHGREGRKVSEGQHECAGEGSSTQDRAVRTRRAKGSEGGQAVATLGLCFTKSSCCAWRVDGGL